MKIRTLCAALFIFPSIAMAGVNTKNGDFYISYLDISQARGLDINRAYNSKASEVGWFGFGWGSDFETRMTVMPDGSIVVHENGSGQENYYAPKYKGALGAGVDKIVAVATQRDKLEPEAAEDLRKQLLADENLRRAKVVKYGIQSQLPVGGSAQSSVCDVVTRINDEYQRTRCEHGNDYFDLSGRLLRKEEGDYKVTLHYAGKYPDRIEDSIGQKLFLSWTDAGHVARAWTNKAEPIIDYRYDEKDNLLMANTIGGNFYRYEYDSNHDMTRIGYIDHTHMDMQYDDKSLITSVTNTDGSKATYSYREDPYSSSSHYWTTTTLISVSGEQSSREEEFLLGTDAAGVEHIAGLTRTDGQRKQDVVMDEQGRIKFVRKPYGGFSEYIYHPTLNKVSSVLTDEGRTDFEYDKAGDLILAKNSQGQLIKLDYDKDKRIIRMVETNKSKNKSRRELTFKYNALGKPIKIKMIGKGEIDIKYDEQGEISKVDSKQGSKMALEVTDAFQILLKVTKVAGVDLGM